jgi:hypothetical protein
MKRGGEAYLNVTDDLQLRRYFLGTLGAGEREVVESRLFGDEAFWALGEAVEAELMDEYVGGGMGLAERAQWETYMATHPRSRERLAVARGLDRKFGGRRYAWWMGALAAAAVLLVCLWVGRSREFGTPAPVVLAVALTPGGVRAAEAKPQSVSVRADVAFIRFEWKGVTGMEQVSIRHIDSGRVVWTGATGALVPVSAFDSGQYVATGLDRSGEEIADFVFSVISQ